MKIENLCLRNYRGHESLDLVLDPHFNLIVGLNGSGKTSILDAVCTALTGFPAFVGLNHIGYYAPLDTVAPVRMTHVAIEGRYRVQYHYPASVSASADVLDLGCAWSITKNGDGQGAIYGGRLPGSIYQERSASNATQPDKSQVNLPVLAFYRANRRWSSPLPSEMNAAVSRIERADGYKSWWDASVDVTSLQSWVISKCLERYQSSSETGKKFDDIDSDELALVNGALSSAIEEMAGLKYDMRQKSLTLEWMLPGRDSTSFENLSDGQRAVVALIADIARRMCILNPHLGKQVTKITPGVVVIDEIDMHLHPKWQRLLIRGLKAAFPEVQFVAASHSPQVIGELQPHEIILLRDGNTAHPRVSYGLTSSQVLEEIMSADARTPDVEELINSLFQSLERSELTEAREKIAQLESIAPGIPEIAGGRALLKRKEVLGR